MKKRVSILMAVYNTEKYLHDSIGSVLGQTSEDWQLVCVDDCSTDDSFSILKEYKNKDNRIKVLRREENGGPSKARNMALNVADGDYIIILDSDDWLDSDCIKNIIDAYEKNPETDIMLLEERKIFPDGTEKEYDWRYKKNRYEENPDGSFRVMKGKDAFTESLSWAIHGLYAAKKWLYDEYKFDESCKYFCEDNLTRLHYYLANEVRCCKGKYYYRILDGSISRSLDLRRLDHLKANISMKEKLIQIGADEESINIYEFERWKIVVDTYMFYFLNRKTFDKEQRNICLYSIRNAWRTIEPQRIGLGNKIKLGYIPFIIRWLPEQICWSLFRADEEIYFTLKKLFGRT